MSRLLSASHSHLAMRLVSESVWLHFLHHRCFWRHTLNYNLWPPLCDEATILSTGDRSPSHLLQCHCAHSCQKYSKLCFVATQISKHGASVGTVLKSLYPSRGASSPDDVVDNPWYLVAAVAFTASRQPDAVPLVYEYALNELQQVQGVESPERALEQCMRLTDRLREALLQSMLLCGAPRVIESYYVLSKVIPESLRSKHVRRDTSKSLDYYREMGEKNIQFMYRERADVLNGLEKVYADAGWWTRSIGYGITYAGTDLLNPMETNFVAVAAIVPMDAPRQLGWQLANARNMGATLEEARAVREIAVRIAERSGVQWKDGVPEVN